MKKEKIGNILQMQRGYDLPSSQMNEGEIPVVGSNGIVGYHDVSRCIIPTITIGRSGSAGKVHIYDTPTWVHNTALYLTDFKGNNPQYLYYLLQLLHLEKLCGSSVIPSLNRNVVYPMIVNFHEDRCEQDAIAYTLSLIDEKIALNREINRNLEAMARQLYEYWFVQFDFPDENGRPYKSSGGKMVWNEKLKRDIPYRWSFTSFDKICQVNRGASPRPIDAFMDETHKGMPWLKISDATSCDSPFIHVIKEHIIDQGINKSVTVLPETLIVSNSATPGIPKYIGIKACVHDGWLVLTKYSEVLKYYLYFVIQDLRNMLVNTASGSVFKNLKTDYLKQAPIILPPDHIISCFHDRVSCIMDTINLKTREIIELQAQRDELLPLLMNGQVSVMPSEVNCDLSHD